MQLYCVEFSFNYNPGQREFSDCDRGLIIAACRALNLNNPGSTPTYIVIFKILEKCNNNVQCQPKTCMDILRYNSSASSGYYQIWAANMAQLCRSTVTWRGPTVEEREAGQECFN